MLRFVFLPLILACFGETMAQSLPPYPKAQTTMHANRVHIGGVWPGGVRPGFPTPSYVIDFNGDIKPNAGIGGMGLWIGGLDTSGQVRVACLKEEWHAFANGPLTGHPLLDSLGNEHWGRFFSVYRADIEAHRTDWADNGILDNPLPVILGWPGKGNPHFESAEGFPLPDKILAPFADVNHDGIYNPLDGDYPHPPGLDPDILPGQIVWNVFNDVYGRLQFAPLGLDVQSTAWALDCDGDNLLNETVFFSFRITNHSGMALDSVSVGILLHKWLGALFASDNWGTYAPGNSVFIYNNSPVDTVFSASDSKTAFGKNPPVVSFTYLNQELARSIYMLYLGSCDPDPIRSGPFEPLEYYHFLNGHWRDGSSLKYGGAGVHPDSIPTNYAYPDEPNEPGGWSMQESLEAYWGICMKILPSVYLGNLPPDTSVVVETAYAYHRGAGLNNLQNITYCFDRIGHLQALYEDQFSGACTYALCMDDCVWPGDLDRDGIVRLRDILPLGVGWKSSGEKRPGPITWAPHTSQDWDILIGNDYDFKHLDANGDGALDSLDFTVIQTFLGLQTPGYFALPDKFVAGDGLWLSHSSSSSVNPNNVQPNKTAYIRLNINAPDLAGLAFEIVVDTNYWNISSANWVNLSQALRLLDIKGSGPDAAAVFTEKTQKFAFNTNYFALFLASKAIPDSLPDTTFVRLKNIRGVRADGSEVPLGANELRYCFGGSCPPYVGTKEPWQEPIALFPNPALPGGSALLHWRGAVPAESVELYDTRGRLLWRRAVPPGIEQLELPAPDAGGVYVLMLRGARGSVALRWAVW